jgi:hypothetical protein
MRPVVSVDIGRLLVAKLVDFPDEAGKAL